MIAIAEVVVDGVLEKEKKSKGGESQMLTEQKEGCRV